MPSFHDDAKYADVFLCDTETQGHDYYYISPYPIDSHCLLYRVNRLGVETHIPDLFVVERSRHTPCCEIFCILSGKGHLTYRGKDWSLHAGQVVILLDGEAHSYSSNPNEPFSKLWVEFYGSDSHRIVSHLIDSLSPVIDGPIFDTACNGIWTLQEHLMENKNMDTAADLYQILLSLLHAKQALDTHTPSDDYEKNFFLVESYINTHISKQITDTALADLCGISIPYFTRCFRKRYHCSPQQYILRQRVAKAKYALTQTNRTVETIASQLGFCNTSYFIRRFRQLENFSPAQYRKLFSIS